jgi:putative protease
MQPELLSPAGDMEKLKFALAYGADAVYLGGGHLSLRAGSGNFGPEELWTATAYAHGLGAKVYYTLNAYARNRDFETLPEQLRALEAAGVDALIVADPGVFKQARALAPGLPIHISTQANTTNHQAVAFWHGLGACRAILARELSLEEIQTIHAHTPPGFTLEAFVHGAMCVSVSGRCLLSAYLAGRDANQGLCAHPCRYTYRLVEETRPGESLPLAESPEGTRILSARDLCMIAHLPDLLAAGVGSLKIEGRMKSAHYVAAVTKAYREALDDLAQDPALYAEKIPRYVSDLQKAESRPWDTGFYYGHPAQTYGPEAQRREFLAVALGQPASPGYAWVEQRNKFSLGEVVEVFSHTHPSRLQTLTELYDETGGAVPSAPHPRGKIKIKVDTPLLPMDILRRSP